MNEGQEKFGEILNFCLIVLSDAMRCNDQDVFKLLDPLISDTQCQIHAVVLLDILHQCYDNDKLVYHGIDKLQEKQRRILSYAVLLSLLKIECEDEFGFVVYEASVNDFGRSILCSRKREKYHIIKAKEEFNEHSVDYVRRIADNEVREILSSCAAMSTSRQFKFLPCYASLWAIVDHLQLRGLPIIISLITIEIQAVDGSVEYKIKSKDVRYHEFLSDKKKYHYSRSLTESEEKIPTIAFCCYRFVSEGSPQVEIEYDARDLILWCSASHPQLPKVSKLPSGYESAEEYADCLYRKHAGLYDQFEKHRQLIKLGNFDDLRYSTVLSFSRLENTVTIQRREEDAPCMVHHVYLSNYSNECRRLRRLDVASKVEQIQVFKLNKQTIDFRALRRLIADQNC